MEARRRDTGAVLGNAQRAEHRTRSASRWFSTYLGLLGCLALVWIVALEALFPSGAARVVASAAGAGIYLLLWRWAESHDVHPRGAARRITVAGALWFGSYLFLIGPLVRWRAGDAVVPWSLAAAIMAAPFFVAAWLERRRS